MAALRPDEYLPQPGRGTAAQSESQATAANLSAAVAQGHQSGASQSQGMQQVGNWAMLAIALAYLCGTAFGVAVTLRIKR